MPMEFSAYIIQLNDAILLENGPNVDYLLRPTSPHGKDVVKEFRNPTVGNGRSLWNTPWNYFNYFSHGLNMVVISVLQWVDMKGVWRLLETTFRPSMHWYARMLRKSVMWRLLKRNHKLFRQSFLVYFMQVSSLVTAHFWRLFLRFFTENRGWTLPALFSEI